MKPQIIFTIMLIFSTVSCQSFSKLTDVSSENGTTSIFQPLVYEVAGNEIFNLFQSWTHSREEEENLYDKEQIFRPSNYRVFAPSRFRMIYEFSKNGNCSWFVLHPANRHYMEDGKFTFDPKRKEITIFNKSSEIIEKFKILNLGKDKLTIEKISTR